MLRAVVAGRSEREPQRVGCRAVLTFASVPLCGGDESSGPGVFPLYLAIDPAGQSCRRPSKASAFYFKRVREREALSML